VLLGLGAALLVLLSGCPLGSGKQPIPVSEGEFDRVVLRSKQPVLVDFSASWCGPCRQMEPVLEELASELAGKVKVVQVDVDQAQGLSRKYGVSAIPCFIVFKNGTAVARQVGATSKQHLQTMLQRYR
jgi:thioredoxin 1